MSQYPPHWEIEKGGPAVGEKQYKNKTHKTKTKHDKVDELLKSLSICLTSSLLYFWIVEGRIWSEWNLEEAKGFFVLK
jgi:hypothetical protein